MDKITITISTTNAAFADGDLHFELARILKKLAIRIENEDVPETLSDYNGNKVGTVEVE